MPTHHETRRLPYTARQMYDLVADVPRYPEFLPWNSAARIRSRTPVEGGEVMEADLVISFKVFRERFGSRVTLLPAQKRIEIQSEFVGQLTDSLKTGIGAMVDTDMEEASARLQALQVQQQLATQALSIANQQPQGLLSLFR